MVAATLAKIAIAGMTAGLIAGIVGVLMALRHYPAYLARCREQGVRPGLVWSSRYLNATVPDSARKSARRGIVLFGLGFAVVLLSFPFVLLAGTGN